MSIVEIVLDGTLTAQNKTWAMRQMHFHTPSEHRIDLAHHEAELHMVFQNEGTSEDVGCAQNCSF